MKTHRTVIVNTSPLFYLHRAGCLDCLEKLYGEAGFYLSDRLVVDILKMSGE